MSREMIDYKALAERIKAHAEAHEEIAGDETDGYSEEQRGFADDLRTVVSLLEGMANAEPIYFVMSGDSWVEVSKEMQARHGTKWQRTLYTNPAPQPQPEPTEAQIDAVADVLFNLYCAEGPRAGAAADAVLRAALAAKEQPK